MTTVSTALTAGVPVELVATLGLAVGDYDLQLRGGFATYNYGAAFIDDGHFILGYDTVLISVEDSSTKIWIEVDSPGAAVVSPAVSVAGGGGGDSSSIFDVFAAGELPYGGIRASYGGADGSWSARGIQSVSGVQASVLLPISGTPGAGWRFTFEEALETGAAGNAWRLLRFVRSPIIPAVAASVQWEYTPGRHITVTVVAAGTAGNADAINAISVPAANPATYIRSTDGGARYDIRYPLGQTVAAIIIGANAAFSDVVLSPGTGYQATDTPTDNLFSVTSRVTNYVSFSRGAAAIPAETILATVHSAPSVSFTLRIAATDTLADIRSEISSYLTSEGIVLSTVGVVDEATDTFDVPAVDQGLDFAGGVNAIPLGASIDDTSKIIDVTYDAGTNTLAEILAEMATAGIQPEYRGSVDGTESPEAVGWVRTLGPITAAGATTGTGPTAPALTGAQIKQRYESNANTNAFTNAEQTKLGGSETGATADQTAAEIKASYESDADTNAFTNALKTKLDGITGATSLPVVNLGGPTAVEAKGLTFATPTGYPAGGYPRGTLISFGVGVFGTFAASGNSIAIYIGTDRHSFEREETGTVSYLNLYTDSSFLAVIKGSKTLQLIGPLKPEGSDIKRVYEGESDTNAFTNALKTKLEGVATAATAVSIAQVLAKILAGAGININTATVGQITISATGSGGGGGGGTADGVVTSAVLDSATEIVTLTTTTGGQVTLDLGAFITATELTAALVPYTKADGSVPFTAVVTGVTPTDDAHLSTKKYVDDADALKASLAGATFTGATKGIAPVAGADFVTLSYFGTHRSAPPLLPDDLYFGISDDEIPIASELTVEGVSSTGTIDAYVGNKHLLIARLATEADLFAVTLSSDAGRTNQLGGFTKFATPVRPDSETEDFSVWVSNQALTNTKSLVITVG